ncbi:MAG: hypothetical protein QXX85_08415 [Candidatus Nitrosotenuis sp.]
MLEVTNDITDKVIIFFCWIQTGSGHLRWALTECIHTHTRYERNSNITRFYKRVAKKKGAAKATVAAASKLLRVIYCMLREHREYRKHYS